jgi:gas vesicle protein
MSIKDFIAKNLFESDEKPVPVPPKAAAVVKGVQGYRDSNDPAGFPGAAYIPPVDADPYRKHFADLISSNNQPGIDYYEYVNSKNKMPLVMPESQRYQIAFESLAAAGLTKEAITRTANIYSMLIDKDIADFNSQFQTTYKQQVDDNTAAIAQKQKQIEQLTNDIRDLQDKVSKGNALTAKRDAFNSAGQEAKSTIADELQKINSFIQ